MATDLTSEWREIGARPISADAPAGAPARDDADFQAIQEEIHKMEALVGKPVDWKRVVDGGRTVLSERSKDLLAASYVCLGLFHTEGVQGLAAGLACLHDMTARYWDTLYPDAKRAQKRIDVLDWLREKLESSVSRRSPSPQDREALPVCEELAQTLDDMLLLKLGEKAPKLAGLRNVLKQQRDSLIQPPSNPLRGAQEAKSADGPAQPVGVARTISTDEDCRSALREVDQLTRKAAAFARSQDPTMPWPYRMVRVSAWMALEMPSVLNDGVSRIPPPAPNLVQRYREQEEKGLWSQLVEQVEAQFPNQPFWLDPHRMIVRAMKELGPSYHLAQELVENEIRALVCRLPELPACRFSDDTPFAEEETRRWLDGLQLSSEAPAAYSERNDNGKEMGDTERVAELQLHAASLMGRGQVREAIVLLQKESASMGSERDRFLFGLEMAKLCLRAGHQNIALSQLEGLDERITRFSLDQWEPRLCLEVWKTMWQLLQQLGRDSKRSVPEWASRCEVLYRRICGIDVLFAWDLETKRHSVRSIR